jgi:hypothetical protein
VPGLYGSEDADVSSTTDLEFGFLANSLALLLEAAKTDLTKGETELHLLRQLLDRRIRKESDYSHISNEDYPCNQYCPKQC